MFGRRIELARKRSGLSLRALSEALDGSPGHRAIREFEKEEATPDGSILKRLSEVLDVSLEFQMGGWVSRLEGLEFRKLASSSVRDRARVEIEVIDLVDRYLSVEVVLELDAADWKSPIPLERPTEETEAEEVADRLRDAWDLGDDPIPDLTELLEERGLKVLAISLPASVSGLTCWAVRPKNRGRLPVIVVNRDHGLERRRFTLAHELAHRVMDTGFLVKPESAANRFAGAFLVPASHLRRHVSSDRHPSRRQLGYDEVIRLKRYYRVSAAAILIRLGQIGVLHDEAVRRAFQGIARNWRKCEPLPIETDGEGSIELPRRFEHLCHWALAERQITPLRAAMLLRVPMTAIEAALQGSVGADANCRY